MAAQTNGRVKKPKAVGSNGHLNGHLDVSKLSPPVPRVRTARKQKKTIMASAITVLTRLFSWYFIATILFRCPSSITRLDDKSPQICRPYLHARSWVTPYLDPYYQSYIAPQVSKAQPYIDRFDAQVYTPVKSQYIAYGAPQVERTRTFVAAQWEKSMQPQVEKVQAYAKEQYDQHIGPHINKVTDVVSPHLEDLKKSTVEIYDLTLLPTYKLIRPYAQTSYAHGHHAVAHIIFPFVRTSKDATLNFLSRTVWPHIRILYADNVEPQLVRIRERLGRYRDGKKLEAFVSSVDSSTILDIPTTSIASSLSSTVVESSASTTPDSPAVLDLLSAIWAPEPSTTQTSSSTSAASPPPKPTPSLSKTELQEKLKNDIRHWQSKFAAAADKGAEDLEERIAEISKRQVESGVRGHGTALLVQLQEGVKSTVEKFKSFIKQTVETVPEEATQDEVESAYEKCVGQSRSLGLAVKEKAQAIRSWKAAYDQETDYLVKAAVDNTLEVLGRIHDLGLQEIGLRWAWMDGVTYKDWQNYHKLRETFTEWEKEIEALGASHDGLRVAHEESKKLEDEAMTIASDMVRELLRLKEVARWKIWAGDASDDFSNKKVPARAFKAAQAVVEKVEDAASQVSESMLGTSEKPALERATSTAKEALHSASQSIESASKSIEPAIKSKGSELKSAIYGADDAVVPRESNASVAEKEEDSMPENKSMPHIRASDVPKKVFGGAMAFAVADAKQIIFDEEIDDDDDSYSERVQSILAGAGEYATDLTRAVSEALLGKTSTQGSVESVTSLASKQYESALAAASSVLYGTKQQPIESMTSVASEKYAQAVTAASYAIYGTPTPTAIIKSIQVEASSQYDNAVRQAQEQYSKAVSQLSLVISGSPTPAHEQLLSSIEKAYSSAVSGTPTPAHEQLISSVQKAYSEAISGTPKPAYEHLLSSIDKSYSDSLAAASARLQAALRYTDSAQSYFARPTQGAFESVSSVAASKLSEGLSLASAQFRSEPTPLVGEARKKYYEAIGLAHARYAEFLDTASTIAYGPQQGTWESIASVVSASAASIASEASSTIIGSETPWAESVASAASASAQSLASGASSAASAVSESAQSLASGASSAVIGTETPWAQSVASKASQNWEALISKASTQVYGAPTPFAESVYSQAASYGAQATAQAVQQYVAVQALISELVVGKEPDFTESVMNRLSSAYYTGYPAAISSASSYASENYEAASSHAADAYASASSVVSSIFTPPPAIESILNDAADQANSAVEAVSIQLYGTPKGTIEAASESVASAYSSIQSRASVAIYGTPEPQGYFADVAASAQKALSDALLSTPTPTGYVASATDGAASAYSSISSVASQRAAEASAAASSAIYGPEQGALESATSRLSAAIVAANSRISEMLESAKSSAAEAASTVSSAATAATQSIKDEL